jgi:uncharacterized peroxidase-related enzyme
MSYVERVQDGELPDVCAADCERLGYVPNYMRVLAHRPAAYAAWKQLIGAIRETMEERRYELATLAAARRLRSSYCSLAHGKVLAERFYTPAEVAEMASGRAAGLDEVGIAVMELADKVAADATSVTSADVDRLRDLGLNDAEIVDVALAAAARCFFSKMLDALGAEPDSTYRELDPVLRDSLTVGRAIAAN